jgi:hypothetical protein
MASTSTAKPWREHRNVHQVKLISSANSTNKSYRPDRTQGDVAGTGQNGAARDADWGTNRGWQKCQFMKRLRSIAHDSLACGAF